MFSFTSKRIRLVGVGVNRYWICILLCVCSWRGPIPWFHRHSEDDSIAHAHHWQEHLRRFHAHELGTRSQGRQQQAPKEITLYSLVEEADDSESPEHLHWHIVFVSDVLDLMCGFQYDQNHSENFLLDCLPEKLSWQGSVDGEARVDSLDPNGAHSFGNNDDGTGFIGFTNTFLATVSLRALFAVARC